MMEHAPSRRDQPDQSAAHHVASGIAKLGLVGRAEAWQARGSTGLTPTQAKILSLLQTVDPQPMKLRSLAEGIGVGSATASESLDALASKGLITRTRSPSDARALAVSLTSAGREEATLLASRPDAILAAASELGDVEQAAFLRGLMKMLRRLQHDGRAGVTRMCVTCRLFTPNAYPDSAERPHHCGYADASFGDRQLRIDCSEHDPASERQAEDSWRAFAG